MYVVTLLLWELFGIVVSSNIIISNCKVSDLAELDSVTYFFYNAVVWASEGFYPL